PFLRIAEDLVGFFHLFKFFLGVRRLVHIRVVFAGQLPLCLADLFGGSVPTHAQHFVIVALAHRVTSFSCRPWHLGLMESRRKDASSPHGRQGLHAVPLLIEFFTRHLRGVHMKKAAGKLPRLCLRKRKGYFSSSFLSSSSSYSAST